MKFEKDDELEIWAHQRAQQIVFREGASLTNAAQWLDKKRTADSTYLLREAIASSLIEAINLANAGNGPSPAE